MQKSNVGYRRCHRRPIRDSAIATPMRTKAAELIVADSRRALVRLGLESQRLPKVSRTMRPRPPPMTRTTTNWSRRPMKRDRADTVVENDEHDADGRLCRSTRVLERRRDGAVAEIVAPAIDDFEVGEIDDDAVWPKYYHHAKTAAKTWREVEWAKS